MRPELDNEILVDPQQLDELHQRVFILWLQTPVIKCIQYVGQHNGLVGDGLQQEIKPEMVVILVNSRGKLLLLREIIVFSDKQYIIAVFFHIRGIEPEPALLISKHGDAVTFFADQQRLGLRQRQKGHLVPDLTGSVEKHGTPNETIYVVAPFSTGAVRGKITFFTGDFENNSEIIIS